MAAEGALFSSVPAAGPPFARPEGDPHGRTHQRHTPQHGVVDFPHELVDAGLLAGQPFGQGVALGHGGGLGQERRLPLIGRAAAEGLHHLLQPCAVPFAVGQLGESFGCRVVEAAVVQAQQAAQLAPAFRAAEVDHDGAAARRVEDPQDRRLGLAHNPGPAPFAMEDGGGVEEEQCIEERGLDVLAVAGRGALDQRGPGTQDGHERRRHAGHGERQPYRIVPGEEALLRTGPGVHQWFPSRLVAGRSIGAPGADGAGDQARPVGPQGGGGEPETRQRARPQVLDDEVGLIDEVEQRVGAGPGAQVELDGLLAPVPGGEAGGIGP